MLDLGQVCLWICEQPAPVTAISDTALIAWSARTQRALHCLTVLREEEDERRRARRDHAQAKKKKTAKTET